MSKDKCQRTKSLYLKTSHRAKLPRDTISGSWEDGKIAWYENMDGMGNFGPQRIIMTSGYGVQSVFSCDLDNDNDYDVLSALDDRIVWFENLDGLGSFDTQHIITSNVGHVNSAFGSDLDGDGDCDVLASVNSAYTAKITWYKNIDTQGNFGHEQIISITSFGEANSVIGADLNGDGYYDILSASSEASKIAWYRNEGPTQELELVLSGINTVIPVDGGTITYSAHLVSHLPNQYPNVYYWTNLVLPNGNPYGPITQQSFTLQPYMDVTVTDITQNIPGYAPAGEYEFWMYVGYLNDPLVSDSFTFTKEGVLLSGGVDNWDASGNWLDDVFADKESLPVELQMESAYPNPFNPTTNISVGLPEAADLTVGVYNTLGQQVALLAAGRFSEGYHTFTFNANGLSSGIYFVKAVVPGKMNEIQKVLLVR